MELQNNPSDNPQGNQPLQPNPPVFSPQTQATPQYPEPQQAIGYPPQQPIHQPASQYNPPTPVNPTIPNYSPNTNSQNKSHKKLFTLILVILVIVIAGVVFALTKQSKNSTGTALSCTPSAGSSINEAVAETEYKTFADAIKQKDQTCVNALSSNYFEEFQNKSISTSSGDWITKSEGGLPSVSSRLSDIPTDFNAPDFTSTSYTRPGGLNQSSSTGITGTTLSYEVTDSYSKSKVNMEISFVSEDNKIVVDSFELVPAALNNL